MATEQEETKMIACANKGHVIEPNASGYGTCTLCGFSELSANYNMYKSEILNK